PMSLTEYASPTNSNIEVTFPPDFGIFAQDQWTLHRVTLNLGLRYEYHRTKADPVTTFAGPLVDSHALPGLDCIPCWHDIDPRFGIVWDVFGDGKTAIKGQLGPYGWAGSLAMERQLANGVALTAGFYRTVFGNFTVTRNTAVTPADFSPYCFTAPNDPRLPASVSGQQICGLYDVNPDKFGQVTN